MKSFSHKIIADILNGDRVAERKLYDLYADKVLALCKRYQVAGHDSMDLHQECFIHIFENIQKYDAEKGPFSPWMYRVCINKILQIQKAERKVSDLIQLKEVSEWYVNPESNSYENISFSELLSLLNILPDGYRIVFNLYAIDGWSHDEIAAKLNISSSTSRSQYHRAKKMLKKI